MQEADAQQSVRIRTNVSGERLIGFVHLPLGRVSRLSDVLNAPEPFLHVQLVDDTAAVAIRKTSISYIEAFEEPPTERRVPLGTFHSVVAEFGSPVLALKGELFVAATANLLDVLNDPRPFVNLRNVVGIDSVEHYKFLAVGKHQMRLLRCKLDHQTRQRRS